MINKTQSRSRSRQAIRRALFTLSFTGAAVCTAMMPTVADAAPPAQQKTQVPGFFRMKLGDFEVTALYDGYIDLDPKILKGASAKDIQSLLARMFLDNTPGVQTAVNGFLVHTGDHLILVDTGSATAFGPTVGAILGNIRAAGYDPAQIDTVLLTHLHADHSRGLLTADGKAAFPNAEVRVAKADADFWLDEQIAAKAPEGAQPMFKLAREAVAPYVAAGKFKTFAEGEAPVPGVVVSPSPGHTPGHSGYLFTSKGQSLLVWGDIVHNHAAQFARPEIAIEFDIDSKQAIASRKKVFADAAKNKLWVAGAHLPFPGIGHVRAEAKNYAWVPVEYGPIRSDR